MVNKSTWKKHKQSETAEEAMTGVFLPPCHTGYPAPFHLLPLWKTHLSQLPCGTPSHTRTNSNTYAAQKLLAEPLLKIFTHMLPFSSAGLQRGSAALK